LGIHLEKRIDCSLLAVANNFDF